MWANRCRCTVEHGDPFDLQRFVDAQAPVYDAVLDELRDGRKRSHWMWFVFPQLRGLGSSPTAVRLTASRRVDEARAYLAHDVLGPRLRECAAAGRARSTAARPRRCSAGPTT